MGDARSQTCLATGCDTPVGGNFFCSLHWGRLPGRLRARISAVNFFRAGRQSRDIDRAVELLDRAQ